VTQRVHRDYVDKKCPCGGKYGDETHTNPDCANFSTHTTKAEIEQLRRFMHAHWGPEHIDAHTAGKAHSYLGRLEHDVVLKQELGWKTSRFVDACRGVSSGRLEWRVLKNAMNGWF
jgi:hypothetical protein